MSDMTSNIFEAVDALVSRRIDSTPIDMTVTATITKLHNVSIGEYKATYQGNTFSAFSLDPMTVYTQGEEVYVLVPKGDFSSKKVILGKAAFNDKVSFADRQAMQNQWRTRGPNWLSPEMYWRNNEGNFLPTQGTIPNPQYDPIETPNAPQTIAADLRRGEIVVTSPEDDINIVTPSAHWRDYIFYRTEGPKGQIPFDNEQNYPTHPNHPAVPPNIRALKTHITPNRPDQTVLGKTQLERVDSELQLWGSQMDYIMVMADFQTLLLDVHSSGEYGVLVECFVDNPRFGLTGYPDAKPYETMKFALTFGDFNGSRYNFSSPTPQRAVFAAPRGVIKGLAKVSLFQTEGWKTDIQPNSTNLKITFDTAQGAKKVLDRDNILAENVAIYWCEPVNLDNKLFWLKVDAIKGTSLFNTPSFESSHITSVPLQARLMYGGKDVTSQETCKFVWFRQKYSALREQALMTPVNSEGKPKLDKFGNTWAGYLPEGENGWAPIELLNKSSNPLSPNYDSLFGEDADYSFADDTFHDVLNIKVEDVPWRWKYMVVCYYNPEGGNLESIQRSKTNDALIWEFETIRNISSDYDFEIPKPIVGENLSDIFLRVRNNTLPWEEGVCYDSFNPAAPDPTKDWYCRWWWQAGETYNSAQQDPDFPRFIKGRRRVDQYLLNEPITFKAQIYGRKEMNIAQHPEMNEKARIEASAKWPEGTPAQPIDQTKQYHEYEIANIERAIIPDNNALVHIRFVGTRHHNYNSDGSIRLSEQANSQYTIRAVITPRDESVTVFGVEWLAPDGTPLKELKPEEVLMGTGYDPKNSMCHSMWMSDPERQRAMHYKVSEKFIENNSKTETNTALLRIRFLNGAVHDEPCVITFTTASGNGSQGSEWTAQIWPTNPELTLDRQSTASYTPWSQMVQEHPRPLVVRGSYDSTARNLNAEPDYKLFLRPFITRNGVSLDAIEESSKYSYKVYWDVRYPEVKNPDSPRGKASGGSFLKLNHVTDARAINDLGDSGINQSTMTTLTNPPGKTNPANTVGYQAYTNSSDTESGGDQPIHGAIEVQWGGLGTIQNRYTPSTPDLGRITMSDLGYSFVVKAQIEIFYSDGVKDKKVASIFSYHGVDVVFTGSLTAGALQNREPNKPNYFIPSKIKTNWPLEVLYSSSGIAPTVISRELRFHYGDNIDNDTEPFPISAIPVNLTTGIQDLSIDAIGYKIRGPWIASAIYGREDNTVVEGGIERDGLTDVVTYEGNFYAVRKVGSLAINTPPDQSSLNDPNWVRIRDLTEWKLRPRAFYFFEDMDNGALRTDIVSNTGKWPSTATDCNPDFDAWHTSVATLDDPLRSAVFVRPIIYRIAQFGNDQINGWDGKSIDINEDNGTIFAPTIGAGWKHPFTNTFSGVIMGIDKSQKKQDYDNDYGGFSPENLEQNPYMTGLYGYQDGVNSFGIMENGTAFFGRADRGGRIIIDGFNAQIYGGVSVERDTGLGANMRNRMRLSFIDFGGAAATTAQLEDPSFLHGGVLRPPTSGRPPDAPATQTTSQTTGLGVDEMPAINMGGFEVELDQQWTMTPNADRWFGNFRSFFAPGIGNSGGDISSPGEDPWAFYYGGFATGHGFSTPAIEIGSYEDWVKNGNNRVTETREQWKLELDANTGRKHPYRAGRQLIRRLTIEQVRKIGERDEIKLLEIPGFRRFLVTYDGTLYAMNAFIMGTIMGSNIIGSQFFTDTGAGVITNYILGFGPNGPATYKQMNSGGNWSHTTPTIHRPLTSTIFNELPATKSEFEQGGDGTPGSGYRFAVGIDGTVVASRLHMTGGSISVGTFHVIGATNPSQDLNEGDVFSFGTMHLIGPNVDESSGTPPSWDEGGTALEAWGNFYLRGGLVNLGRVYLGSTYEKTTEAESGYYNASSFNAPISIEPTQPDATYVDDAPKYPVKIGVWPLYFHIGDGGKKPNDNSNNTWVTMASAKAEGGTDNGYMPSFSLRPKSVADIGFMTPEAGGVARFANNVTWRLDQIGMWTDGILFTAKSGGTGSVGVPIDDALPLTTEAHGLGYLGWWTQTTYAKSQLRLKNINAKAPSFAIETLRHMRFSAGKDQENARNGVLEPGDDYNTFLLDVWDPGSDGETQSKRGAALMLASMRGAAGDGRSSGLLMNSSVIGLETFLEESTGENNDGLQAFLHLGGIGSVNTHIQDEMGRDIGRLPKYDTTHPGRIWMKGMGIAIDGAINLEDIKVTELSATVRINRSYDGSVTTSASGSGPDGLPVGANSAAVVAIGGGDIAIRGFSNPAGGLGNVHIWNIGSDNGTGSNEVFLDKPGNALRLTGAQTLSLGVASEGHAVPARGLQMTASELKVFAYTAEQQVGIYARFA